MPPESERVKPETHLKSVDEQIKLRVSDDDDNQSTENQTPGDFLDRSVSSVDKSKKEIKPLTGRQKLDSFLRYLAVPAVILLLEFSMHGGLLTPFLNNPGSRSILLSILVWFLIGGAIYCQTREWWEKALCVVVFVLPLLGWFVIIPIVSFFTTPDIIRSLL